MAFFGAFGRRSRPGIPHPHAVASAQSLGGASRNPCREICRPPRTSLQGRCVEQIPKAKRRELLAEIGSEHFRRGMQSWLTSIPADHGLSATPVVELKQIQSEMRYRLKLVKAIVSMMERELDAIEAQIKGKRASEAGGRERAIKIRKCRSLSSCSPLRDRFPRWFRR